MDIKRFTCALLTAVLLYAFAVGSAHFWQWLIPYRWVEVIIWVVVYFTLLGYVLLYWDKWYDKLNSNKKQNDRRIKKTK